MTASTLQPDQILRELNEQWDQLDQEQASEGGVLRACAMTLLATAGDEADAEHVRHTLGELMHVHPSRAVILKIRDGAEFGARVFAECWKPFGSQQQICSEGIEIESDSVHLDDAAHLMVPLKVADLPAVLWCRGPAVFQYRYFDALFPLGDKIVVDSSSVTHAAAALSLLRSLRARGYRVADLHWTRLTGWRETLAQLFDDQSMRDAGIATAKVCYGGATPSTCTLYFASWIESALPQARVSLVAEKGEPGLHSVTLENGSRQLTVARSGPVVRVSGWGRDYHVSLPPLDECDLMREELKFFGADPVFDKVLG